MAIPSFILPANGKATPEAIKRKRRMAEAMMAQGMDTSPVGHWTQGAARMANALVGGLSSRRADTQEAEGQQSAKDAMTKALMGGDKASMLDAASNPFMSDAGMQMVGNAWQQANQPPAPPELKDMGNGQMYQYDPMNPQGGQTFTPPGYQPPPGHRLLTGEEATSMGLPPGAYNMDPEGKISEIGGGGTTINNMPAEQPMIGTIPPGWAATKGPDGKFRMERIEGGPEAAEAEALQTKADTAKANQSRTADIVTQDIDRAISALDEPGWLPKTGLGAETLKEYGGTGAADLAGLLDSVEANTGFDALSAMRAASPTGGALGSITERELQLLAATKGSIKQSQSKEQLKDNLNRLWNVTQDIVHGPDGGPPRKKLKFQEQGVEEYDAEGNRIK